MRILLLFLLFATISAFAACSLYCIDGRLTRVTPCVINLEGITLSTVESMSIGGIMLSSGYKETFASGAWTTVLEMPIWVSEYTTSIKGNFRFYSDSSEVTAKIRFQLGSATSAEGETTSTSVVNSGELILNVDETDWQTLKIQLYSSDSEVNVNLESWSVYIKN